MFTDRCGGKFEDTVPTIATATRVSTLTLYIWKGIYVTYALKITLLSTEALLYLLIQLY
jgi:hypothetical protein